MEDITSIARTRKIGGSLVITIPANIVKEENIQENDLIEFGVKKKRKSYFGALKGIGSFTKEDKFKGQLEE
jgi:antitoxin component of MazEF toxin-antitoxin module